MRRTTVGVLIAGAVVGGVWAALSGDARLLPVQTQDSSGWIALEELGREVPRRVERLVQLKRERREKHGRRATPPVSGLYLDMESCDSTQVPQGGWDLIPPAPRQYVIARVVAVEFGHFYDSPAVRIAIGSQSGTRILPEAAVILNGVAIRLEGVVECSGPRLERLPTAGDIVAVPIYGDLEFAVDNPAFAWHVYTKIDGRAVPLSEVGRSATEVTRPGWNKIVDGAQLYE